MIYMARDEQEAKDSISAIAGDIQATSDEVRGLATACRMLKMHAPAELLEDAAREIERAADDIERAVEMCPEDGEDEE